MPTPDFKLADETLLGKKVRTTYLPSQKIFGWSDKIKQASLFSARTTRKTYLEEIRSQLAKLASKEVKTQQAEQNLKATLAKLGYTPQKGFPGDMSAYHGREMPPATPGSIRDLSSTRRIRLILDVNLKQARAMGQMAVSEDPGYVYDFPAWQLRRSSMRKAPRKDWAKRWTEAGKAVNWEGAVRDPKLMVALKNSPIWEALGNGAGGFRDTLGSPFPPFAFGSGLSWKDVSREKAEMLGIDVSKAKPVMLESNPSRIEKTEAELPPDVAGAQEQATVDEQPKPPPFFPDLSKRNKTLETCRDDLDAVSELAKDCPGFVEAAKKAKTDAENALVAYPCDAATDLLAKISDALESVQRGATAILDAVTRCNGYMSAAGSLAIPENENEQSDFDLKLERYLAAADKTAMDAIKDHDGMEKAADEAKKLADRVPEVVESWRRERCSDMVEEVRPVYEAMENDEYKRIVSAYNEAWKAEKAARRSK